MPYLEPSQSKIILNVGSFTAINGRVFTITPGMFDSTTDNGTTWVKLTALGTANNLVNCTFISNSNLEIKVMILPGVKFFSFTLSNDLTVPKNVYRIGCIDCISLPGISIGGLMTVLGESANNLLGLLTSDKLNPNSPIIPRDMVYIPDGIDINNMPMLVGNSDKVAPFRMGKMIGYCHTAQEGFSIEGWYNQTLGYYASSMPLYATVYKNHIPVSGDLNTSKWDRVRITYDTVVRDNLNFNNLCANGYSAILGTGNYLLKVEYWNGTGFSLMNQKTANIVRQSFNDYVANDLGVQVALSVTSVTVFNWRVNFSLTIKNTSNSTKTVGNFYSYLEGSTRARQPIAGVSCAPGATVVINSYFTWDKATETHNAGDTIYLWIYYDNIHNDTISQVTYVIEPQ